MNQPALARMALERVVGLNPRFAGAWLDLALATERAGDAAAAVEHLEYIRSQFTLSPALAAQVALWLDLWQTSAQATQHTAAASHGWQGEISFSLGRDSNANAGPLRQQIPLSLSTGSTLFDVDKAFQPRAASFNQLGISLNGPVQSWGEGKLSPLLLLRSKQLSSDGAFSPLDLQFGLLYQRPASTGTRDDTWQASLFAQHFRLGGQALFNGLRVGLQRNTPWRNCLASAGSEIEARHQQRLPILSGTLYSVSAGLTCPWPSGSNKAAISGNVKAGFEQASFDRPGGNTRSTELNVRYDLPLSATQSLQASWQIANTADQTGYSPLLESDAARRIQRQTVSLGLRQSISRAWEARLNVEYFQQRSNLPLFEQRGTVLMLGAGWRFE